MKPLNNKETIYFLHQINKLLHQEEVHRMKNFIQHGNTTTFSHCLAVAYYSCLLSLRLPVSFDTRSVIRGAMLHDFFLYDWHIPHKSHKLHGFVHPGFALRNAKKYFRLNALEEEIIAKHMWPFTFFHLPCCREAWLVCLVDKYISLTETLRLPILSGEYHKINRLLSDTFTF